MSVHTTLTVKGIDGIRQFQKRIRVTRSALPSYQLVIARNIAENDVLRAIHDTMRGNGVSEKIIAGTKITRVEFVGRKRIRVYVVSVYFAGTFDVAKARHDGTARHWIEPISLGNPSLHETEPGVLRFFYKGMTMYSKGHFVDGMPSLKYIENVIIRLRDHVSDEFNRQQNIWIGKMLEVK